MTKVLGLSGVNGLQPVLLRENPLPLSKDVSASPPRQPYVALFSERWVAILTPFALLG
jgi:hypothetical protein